MLCEVVTKDQDCNQDVRKMTDYTSVIGYNQARMYTDFYYYIRIYLFTPNRKYMSGIIYQYVYTELYVVEPVSYTHLDVYKRQETKYINTFKLKGFR